MKWHKDLYVGEDAKKKIKSIQHRLEKHSAALGVYVVTLAANGKDLLDVLPAFFLYREKNRDVTILGVAVTKEEALEVCAQMILDVYKKTGGFDVRSYFA